jgi:hypothetical protein
VSGSKDDGGLLASSAICVLLQVMREVGNIYKRKCLEEHRPLQYVYLWLKNVFSSKCVKSYAVYVCGGGEGLELCD